MNRYARIPILLVLAMIAGLILAALVTGVVASPADAATCRSTYVQAYGYRLADDDESETYFKGWERINYTQCGHRETITSLRSSFRPMESVNTYLDCGDFTFSALGMNPTSIAGQNPAMHTKRCTRNGNSTTWDLRNVANPSDRCINTALKVIKYKWDDFYVPQLRRLCIPNR